MSKQDLLIPRYKLVVDYPFNSVFTINEVLKLTDVYDGKPSIKRPYKVNGVASALTLFTEDFFRKFDKNFRQLEWWEERRIEELPAYVKYPHSATGRTVIDSRLIDLKDIVMKVGQYKMCDNGRIKFDSENIFQIASHFLDEPFLISEEQEYLEMYEKIKNK